MPVIGVVAAASIAVVSVALGGGAGAVTSSVGQAQPEVVASIGERPAQATPTGLPCVSPHQPTRFKLFSLGESFEGLPLTTIIVRCDNPPSDPSVGSANYVSYIYGQCDPKAIAQDETADGGCAPPIEIQVWPACERSIADYDITPEPALGETQGVPSATIVDRVELYSADSTVVVFASSPDVAERVARGVLAVPDSTPPAEGGSTQRRSALPTPLAGAVGGKLACNSAAVGS